MRLYISNNPSLVGYYHSGLPGFNNHEPEITISEWCFKWPTISAYVLLHEMGHHKLHGKRLIPGIVETEHEADLYAMERCGKKATMTVLRFLSIYSKKLNIDNPEVKEELKKRLELIKEVK